MNADTEGVTVDVEVCLKPSSTARPSEIRERMKNALEKACSGRPQFVAGLVPAAVLRSDELLARHVQHARVCDIVAPEGGPRGSSACLPFVEFWRADLVVCVGGKARRSLAGAALAPSDAPLRPPHPPTPPPPFPLHPFTNAHSCTRTRSRAPARAGTCTT